MGRKIQYRAESEWLMRLKEDFSGYDLSRGLTLDFLQPLYVAFLDRVFPEIERSTPEEREAAYSRIFDYINGLDDEAEITVKEAVKIGQLKEKSRSDSMAARKMLANTGLLEHDKGNKERFVRRITHNDDPAPRETAATVRETEDEDAE